MNRRKLGNTGISLTELGYGCASLWGKPRFVTDEQAQGLFFTAYEQGVRFFDTGSSYGVAERRLGDCMKKLGKKERQNLVISTKCGTRMSTRGGYYHDWHVAWMQRSLEISMKRLHVDCIDMLQVHGPGINEISDEMLDWLGRLKSNGIIRASGINTFDTAVLEYVSRNRLFDFVMLDYNILRQDREALIKELYDNSIGVVAGAPLAQNLFSNRVYKVRGGNDLWYFLRAMRHFRGHMVEGRRFQFVNGVDGMTGNQVALRYILDNKMVSSAVFGSVNPEHLMENIKSTKLCLPAGVRRMIKAKGRRRMQLDRK